MKKLILMALLILSLPAAESRAGNKERKNKVKSATIMQTDYENGKPVTYKASYEEFDRNGNTTLYNEFSKTGSMTRKETYLYDKNNDLIEETLFDAASGRNVKKIHKYTLVREKTREEEEDTYNAAGTVVKKVTYTYNANGKTASENVSDSTGRLVRKIYYNYNAKNLRSLKQTLSGTNLPENTREWHYEYY